MLSCVLTTFIKRYDDDDGQQQKPRLRIASRGNTNTWRSRSRNVDRTIRFVGRQKCIIRQIGVCCSFFCEPKHVGRYVGRNFCVSWQKKIKSGRFVGRHDKRQRTNQTKMMSDDTKNIALQNFCRTDLSASVNIPCTLSSRKLSQLLNCDRQRHCDKRLVLGCVVDHRDSDKYWASAGPVFSFTRAIDA